MSKSSDPVQFTVPQRSPADRKKKLGKGLGALLGETKREEPLVRSEVDVDASTGGSGGGAAESPLKNLPVSRIEPLPGNPRKHFDEAALDELAASIAARGVIQPIIVRPHGEERYQLVAGERRWRASKLAGRDTIAAVVRDVNEEQLLELALVENIHRSDLNPIEKAEACRNLIEQFKLSQTDAAKRLGKSRTSLTNLLRLLELPEPVRNLLASGALTSGHAKVLLGLNTPAEQISAARRVVDRGLSVRQLEELVQHSKPGRAREPEPKPSYILDLEEKLRGRLGTKVSINEKNEKGRIVIDFYSQDDFERIYAMLEGQGGS